jgi:branched-chain amino acid transport system substrate-binding protein
VKRARLEQAMRAFAIAAVCSALVLGGASFAADAPIAIGHIGSLSGLGADWGHWDHEGIALAVDEINARGGVASHPLALVERDDESKPEIAVTRFKELVGQGVRVIVGGTSGAPTLAMAPLAQAQKIVLVTPSGQPQGLDKFGGYAGQSMMPMEPEGAAMGREILKRNVKSLAILAPSNGFNAAFLVAMQGALDDTVHVTKIAYPDDMRDLPAALAKAFASHPPDGVYVAGGQAVSTNALKALADLGYKGERFAANAFQNDKTIAVLGAKAAQGVIYEYPGLVHTPEAARVQAAFKKRYGREMNLYNALAYDTVMMLAAGMTEAIREGKKPEGDDLISALKGLRNFPGLTGPISWGEVTEHTVEMRSYRNGKFVTVAN